MSNKLFPNCFTLAEIEGYRDVFELNLRDIARARKATGEPYPDYVRKVLNEAMRVPYIDKDGEFVGSEDRLTRVRKHPGSLWVAERCHQDTPLEQAWSIRMGKLGELDAWAQPEAVQTLMRKERAWLFWGQYVLTCYKILSDEAALSLPKTTVVAAQEFVAGGVKACNALSALLADARVLMAVCPQEVPAMRELR